MRKLAEAAEQTEPLLHKRLYDGLRQAAAQQLDQKLDMTRQLLRYGADRQASEMEKQASAGIQQLKEQVERAAESVLGDEASALRMAQAQVEQLAEQLRRDLPESAGASGKGRPDETGQQAKASQPGGKGKSDPADPSRGKDAPRQVASASQPGQPQPSDNPNPDDSPNQPGQPSGQSGRQESQPGQQGDQPGEQGQQPGQQGKSSGQPGKQPGKAGQGQPNLDGSPSDSPQPGGESPQGQASGNPQTADAPGGDARSAPRGSHLPPRGRRFFDGADRAGGSGQDERGPITGEAFRQWSDRLREVEEMLDDPQLRRDAATIRGRAASMRAEFKRHSVAPQSEMIERTLLTPLTELQDRLAAELARRQGDHALAPVDRDPVPGRYSDMVKRYYQTLGGGK
jgi:hypothetical protein